MNNRYSQLVSDELSKGKYDETLWIKMLSKYAGDENAAQLAYIKVRAAQLLRQDNLNAPIKRGPSRSVNEKRSGKSVESVRSYASSGDQASGFGCAILPVIAVVSIVYSNRQELAGWFRDVGNSLPPLVVATTGTLCWGASHEGYKFWAQLGLLPAKWETVLLWFSVVTGYALLLWGFVYSPWYWFLPSLFLVGGVEVVLKGAVPGVLIGGRQVLALAGCVISIFAWISKIVS